MNEALVVSPSTPANLEACWKRIGIWGNKQCPELSHCTHCRNCSVFSAGAAEFMDRPLPEGYRAQWTAHFIHKKADAVLGTLSILIFRAAGEIFALPMRVLQEVADAKEIRSLPHRRHKEVLGLVNVRGELVITVSLGQALGIESPTPRLTQGSLGRESKHRLLIVSQEGERVALLVQEIQGIARINMEDLKDVPATVVHGSRRCVSGVLSWGGKTVGFLDDQKLFKLVNKSLG